MSPRRRTGARTIDDNLRRLGSDDPADWLAAGEADELAGLVARWHEQDASEELYRRIPRMRWHLLAGGPWRPAAPFAAERVAEYADEAVRALVAQRRRQTCHDEAARRGLRLGVVAARVGLPWA